jgi:parallel beta-helix repeat protein
MKSAQLSSGAALVLGLAVVSTPMAATAKSITVRPGESIQAAVDKAAPGDTVKVLSGDYVEPNVAVAAVRITKPLKLMASGQVRIRSEGDQENGILVEGTAGNVIDGVEIVGFTVEGFHGNGIWLAYVKNFNIENNISINNEENGIWPTLSANGQVKKNVAYGSKDSALWVEASENVRVLNNDLHHSPTGLEVTISKNITIENNEVHHNTVGIGLYHPAAAGLPSPYPSDQLGTWRLINNYVHDNNEPNTGEGGEVALIPPGLGMLILGVDRVDVQQNRIEDNAYVGVGMIDWCVAVDCAQYGPPPGYENTAVDTVRVTGNKFAGNHTIPLESLPPELPAEIFKPSDILYIGADLFGGKPGTKNCVSDNKVIKTARNPDALITAWPDPLPTCQ